MPFVPDLALVRVTQSLCPSPVTVVVLRSWFILPIGWYYFPVYGGVHWFEGPRSTVGGYTAWGWATSRDVEGVVDTFEPEKEDKY